MPSPLTITRHELDLFNGFVQSLSPADRQILDDLFESAWVRVSPVDPTGFPLPYLIYLLTLLLDEHRQLLRLTEQAAGQSRRSRPELIDGFRFESRS